MLRAFTGGDAHRDAMPPRALIIHRWSARTDSEWYPWLRQALTDDGFDARVPPLPEPDAPRPSAWVDQIATEVGVADRDVVLIGHGAGAQAVVRYLASLEGHERVGAAVLVAPWTRVSEETLSRRDRAILAPWLADDIDFDAAKRRVDHVTALFSPDDPDIPEDEVEVWRERFVDRALVLDGRGHFTRADYVETVPEVRAAVRELVKVA